MQQPSKVETINYHPYLKDEKLKCDEVKTASKFTYLENAEPA